LVAINKLVVDGAESWIFHIQEATLWSKSGRVGLTGPEQLLDQDKHFWGSEEHFVRKLVGGGGDRNLLAVARGQTGHPGGGFLSPTTNLQALEINDNLVLFT
jgi:hypothetical protein